jgi:hypothetical protein
MARRLFTLLSALSLLLCVATVVLWVRSDRRVSMAGRTVAGDNVWSAQAIAWGRGRVVCMSLRSSPQNFPVWAPPGLWFHRMDRNVPLHKSGTFWRDIGFDYESYHNPYSSGSRVTFPLWLVTGLLLIAPIAKFAAFYRGGRRKPIGLCPRCGYDLRATPDRCPECGAAAAKKQA